MAILNLSMSKADLSSASSFVPLTLFTSLVNGVMNPSITSTGNLADSLNLSFLAGHLISFESFTWFLRGVWQIPPHLLLLVQAPILSWQDVAIIFIRYISSS